MNRNKLTISQHNDYFITSSILYFLITAPTVHQSFTANHATNIDINGTACDRTTLTMKNNIIRTKFHSYCFRSLGRHIFEDGILKLYIFHKKAIPKKLLAPSYCAHVLTELKFL